jgi:hypothetical protein
VNGTLSALAVALAIIAVGFVLRVNDKIDTPTQIVIMILAIAIEIVLLQIWRDR